MREGPPTATPASPPARAERPLPRKRPRTAQMDSTQQPSWLPPVPSPVATARLQRRHESGGAGSSGGSTHLAGAMSEGDGIEAEDCLGLCFAFDCDFVGAPRNQPERTEPNGGWGYTRCCSKPTHFDCMGKHLHPTGKEAATATGEQVQMELCCPFCRASLSRSSRRQLKVSSERTHQWQ